MHIFLVWLLCVEYKVSETLNYYTVDQSFQNLYDKKKFIKGVVFENILFHRKQTLTLLPLFRTIFTGTTIASADEVAPSTAQKNTPATYTEKQNHYHCCNRRNQCQAQYTVTFPADKAKRRCHTWTSRKLAHLLGGAERNHTSTAAIKNH